MNRLIKRASRLRVRQQHGSFLLEGLIALFIFSFGLLGLIGAVAGSIRASNDARYRVEAVNLANAMVGDMWTTRAAALDTEFGVGGSKLTAWRAEVARLLPSATDVNAPVVDLTQAGLSSQSRSVVVTIYWQLPGETQRHQVLLTAQIGRTT
jgi:type IV pilus assembly protein PilV